MDLRKLKKLIDLVQESGIAELEITEGEERVRIARGGAVSVTPLAAAVLPVRRVVLFGSWAKGRATAFSDIDLLVVYADPTRDDAYVLSRRHLPLRGLEPHVYSETEAARLGPTLERMTRDGIVLL